MKLWDGDRKLLGTLRRKGINEQYLPDVSMPDEVGIVDTSLEALEGAEMIVVAVPSHAVREVVSHLAGLAGDALVLSAAKGLEEKTLMRMSQVIEEVLGDGSRIVVLSGPSHAEEVSRHIPTAVAVSSRDEAAAGEVQRVLMSDTLRVYTNGDVAGVELGGALKNPIAIAAGISDGLGFGDNTKAALVTRGLAEMARLGSKAGADPHTFSGLTGMGDLITTCISRHSRNRNLGELIAQGATLEGALAQLGQVAEGVRTALSARALAAKMQVEVPITSVVCEVLFEGKLPRDAVEELMGRRAKGEGEKV